MATPQEVSQSIAACMNAGLPFFIHGKPGAGKSAIVKSVVSEINKSQPDFGFIDIRSIFYEGPDLHGLQFPDAKKKSTITYRPELWPTKGCGLLFFDELNAAPQMVQAALYQVIHEGRCGEHKIPEGWLRGAAGNNDTDRAVTNRMSTALDNRFVHFYFEAHLPDFIEWGLKNQIHPDVLSYLKFKPEHLHDFDPTRQANEHAFPSPRTWEYTSKFLHANPNLPPEISRLTLSGTIGEAASATFMGFLKTKAEIPSKEQIFQHPDQATIPHSPAALYAVCGMLSFFANLLNFPAILKYANRLPNAFSVMLVKDCIKKDADLTTIPQFVEWASDHVEVLV